MNQVIYDVQKFGVTIEFDTRIQLAESAFRQAAPGEVKMYALYPNGRKVILKTK